MNKLPLVLFLLSSTCSAECWYVRDIYGIVHRECKEEYPNNTGLWSAAASLQSHAVNTIRERKKEEREEEANRTNQNLMQQQINNQRKIIDLLERQQSQ
jgi:hypothetical protein